MYQKKRKLIKLRKTAFFMKIHIEKIFLQLFLYLLAIARILLNRRNCFPPSTVKAYKTFLLYNLLSELLINNHCLLLNSGKIIEDILVA